MLVLWRAQQKRRDDILGSTTTTSAEIPPPSSLSVTPLKFDGFVVSWIPSTYPGVSGYRVVVESIDGANDALQVGEKLSHNPVFPKVASFSFV